MLPQAGGLPHEKPAQVAKILTCCNTTSERGFSEIAEADSRPLHAMMAAAAHLLEMKSLTLLGSTGSIGANTLDVVRHNRNLYRVYALAAGHNVDAILQQIIEFRPEVAVLATSEGIARLAAGLSDSGLPRPNWPELAFGSAALIETAIAPAVDMVISAIVGVAGLE